MMRLLNLQKWLWWMTQSAKKLGLAGLVGLAIALCCCLFYAIYLYPLQQQKSAAALQLSAFKNLKHRADMIAEPNDNNALILQDSHADIQHFYARFPQGESLPKWLKLIEEQAKKQHLTLNRGDYKLTHIKPQKSATVSAKSPVSRYEIVLPVTGQYTQIRLFIAQVLQRIPALALSDLHIKRESAQSPIVEARLIFVLLLKGESWQ